MHRQQTHQEAVEEVGQTQALVSTRAGRQVGKDEVRGHRTPAAYTDAISQCVVVACALELSRDATVACSENEGQPCWLF